MAKIEAVRRKNEVLRRLIKKYTFLNQWLGRSIRFKMLSSCSGAV